MEKADKQVKGAAKNAQANAKSEQWQQQLAQVANNSAEAVAQRAMIDRFNHSPRVVTQRKYFESLGYKPTQRKEAQVEKSNKTGLPDNLKAGIESLSGMSLDNVKVHYNSSQPAQLNALAYAQGTDIHVAPGQEKHLPHEAWHVVQQAQGRVQPTLQMKEGVLVNDDQGLEHEADVMGGKAQLMPQSGYPKVGEKRAMPPVSRQSSSAQIKAAISQRAKATKAKKKATKVKKVTKRLKKQTVTVRNKQDTYNSGPVKEEKRATGVNPGPRREAQKVASILGGSWVGGHMINDKLGGVGDFTNIVPISSSMNAKHKTIENKANSHLHLTGNAGVEYKMEILERKNLTVNKSTVIDLPTKFKQTLTIFWANGKNETKEATNAE